MTMENSSEVACELDRRWRPALLVFFLRRVHDRAEAEDLTQEVIVRLLGRTGDEGMGDGYIFRAATNLLADRARRAKVRADYAAAIQLGSADASVQMLDPHRIAEGRAELAAFVAALNRLPERQRTMFTLYRIENMSQDAIAEAFHITPSAVKKQIAKAMASLMSQMRSQS